MTIKSRANEFRVWREADSVDWDCQINELADAVGITPQGVRQILIRRGWLSKIKRGNASPVGRRDIATIIGSTRIWE